MHRYIVCIGSNYNRKENLTFARQKLTESFSSICFAPELETEPLFFKNPALFANQVVMFFSDKDEEVVRKMLKDIEQRSGRRPEDKKEEKVCLDEISWNYTCPLCIHSFSCKTVGYVGWKNCYTTCV